VNTGKALLLLSVLTIAAILLSGVGFSAPPATGTPPTTPAGTAAASPAGSQQANPLWDAKESVADYAKRAGIKDTQITLVLDANVTMKLTLIPAGKFLMGSPKTADDGNGVELRQELSVLLGGSDSRIGLADEKPQHEVVINRPFYMGVYTVTQAEYDLVMGNSPSAFKGAQNPVEMVSWDDVAGFCKSLSQKARKTVRLPTEAEWEYACRAGSKTPFYYGDDPNCSRLHEYAWYYVNSDSKVHPVGQKKPNSWGLYDMHGNVWQWCSDWYNEKYYASANKVDPQGPDSGSFRVLRGGWWKGGPLDCRSAVRYGVKPVVRRDDLGFRVAVELK
jgi:formylglycine-generating enzyme required for sulfatase activity